MPIEGSDTSGAPNGPFQTALVDNELGLSHPNIVELTSHCYPLGACSGSSTPTISELLGTTAHSDETSVADKAGPAAGKLGVPAVLDEGNSVVCEGEDGVSNVSATSGITLGGRRSSPTEPCRRRPRRRSPSTATR